MEEVLIERMSYGTAAVGRLGDGKTVFVEGAAPGDTVAVEVVEDKPRYAKAKLVSVVEPGAHRVSEPLACAGACGGCSWAQLAYDEQTRQKRAIVVDALRRNGGFSFEQADALVGAVRPSKHQLHYRNKIELGVVRSEETGLLDIGFFQEGTHRLAQVDLCPVAAKSIAKAPKALRGAIRFLERGNDLGIFRVGVRGSQRTGDVEIALWTESGAFPRAAAAKILRDTLKATSIVRIISEEGRSRTVKKVEVLCGKGCWAERLGEVDYLTSAPSFFQVNTSQAERLVELALDGVSEACDLDGAFGADLYSGGGTFTVPLALAGADVVSVESAGTSVRDLRRNAERAGVDVEVVGGDAARELPELGELDFLVVDPPRGGLASGMPEAVAAAAPKVIAYVSCDPQTLARDIGLLRGHGYRLSRAVPVDLFPQTYHIETVAILLK